MRFSRDSVSKFSSETICTDYVWIPWCRKPQQQPPMMLSFPGSMTGELARISGVKPLILKREEKIAQGHRRDCLSLLQPRSSWLWQRQIVLGDVQPWLMGFTLALPISRSPMLRELQNMGSRPLGEKLFSSRQVHRLSYSIGIVEAEHGLWQRTHKWFPDLPPALWARRSLFSFHQQPLLIYEVFLPTCPGISSVDE